ncbi:uncharacterized protein [Drosophila kikkawai]
MIKRRLRNVRQWSQRLLNYYEKMRTMKFYKKKEQLDDELLVNIEKPSPKLPNKIPALEDNTSSKAKQPTGQQIGMSNELRRPSTTSIDTPADANDAYNLHRIPKVVLKRNEKDFTCNLVFDRNEMLPLNDLQGKKHQCTLPSKNYVDGIEEDLESEVSESSESLKSMGAASAHPTATGCHPSPVQQKLDTLNPTPELSKNFCGRESHEDQVIEQDTTLAHPEVATSSSQRRSEDVMKDYYQNRKAKPELKTKADSARKETITVVLNYKLIPFPIEGCFILCQWEYLLAAFDARNAFVWAVQTETSLLMAVTTVNQTPSVLAAKNCVNIRNAINQDALPLLALQLLRRGWQKDKTKNRVVGMLGMAGYWHIKRLGHNLCQEISPLTVIPLNEMPAEMLPVPENSPKELLIPGAECSIQTENETETESETETKTEPKAASLDQYQREIARKDKEREKVLLPTVEILDSDEEMVFPKLEIIDSDEEDLLSRLEILHSDEAELLSAVDNFEESTVKNVEMDNQNPGKSFEVDLSKAVVPPKHDKPVIISVEYLSPQVPAKLPNSSVPAQPPTAKITSLMTNENPEVPISGNFATTDALVISKADAAGCTSFVTQKLTPPVAAPQQPSLETPRELLKIYNRPNMPVNGQTLPSQIKPMTAQPVFIKKIVATGEVSSSLPSQLINEGTTSPGGCLNPNAASTLAPVLQDQSKVLNMYPRQNMPVNIQVVQSQTKPMIPIPVLITKIPAASVASSSRASQLTNGSTTSLGVRPEQATTSRPSQLTTGQSLLVNPQALGIKAATSSLGIGPASQKLSPNQAPISAPVSVPLDKKKITQFGFMYANNLPAYPAWVQASFFIVQIPDVEAIVFKSLADANKFLNKYLARIPIFEGLLPADWKFMVRKDINKYQGCTKT